MDESDIVFQLDEAAKRGLACAPNMIPHCLEYFAAREIEKLRSALKLSADTLREHVEAAGVCDHAVGICLCGDYRVLDEAYEALGVTPNVEVTGAARLYRAASVWTAGLGLVLATN
ncbi:MAG: hypothetical protein HS110_07830 [Zoogloeaceae bacterium]|nr:hypothetical protein [Zoogloeaceae bacterium]MCK6563039.1 hypothetical protein [bacterium]